MTKEFPTYNLAQRLKKINFDEPCFAFYQEEYHQVVPIMVDDNDQYRVSGYRTCKNSEIPNHYTAAPTFQSVFKWFRDNYNLFCEIQIDRTAEPKFCFEIFQYEHFGNYKKIEVEEWYLYRTLEEAELAILDKLIQIVENSQ